MQTQMLSIKLMPSYYNISTLNQHRPSFLLFQITGNSIVCSTTYPWYWKENIKGLHKWPLFRGFPSQTASNDVVLPPCHDVIMVTIMGCLWLSFMFPHAIYCLIIHPWPDIGTELGATGHAHSYTVPCRYNAVNFLENPHKRHPIAHP